MEPTPLTDPDRPPEHAFGKIHAITVPVEWAPTLKNPRKKVRRFLPGTTQTWSVNGIGWSSTADSQVEVGDVLMVRIGPVTGEVVVRTVTPGDADDQYFGVEIIGDDLQGVARDLISIHLRHHPDERPSAGTSLDLSRARDDDLDGWS